MAKDLSPLLPFASGNSLFVFEGDHVRVLGEEGTEATVPLEDLRALLEHLASAAAPPFSGAPDPPSGKDQE